MASVNIEKNIIQYVPFMSFVHPSFWHSLTELKIDVDKLSENKKQIQGRFAYRQDIGAVFEVDGTSFNATPEEEQLCYNVTGTLMNKNTIEEFKNIDKAELLNIVGNNSWAEIVKKEWIDSPNKLLNFFILSFADLKKFHYYYWFAFPSPNQPTVYMNGSKAIDIHFNNKELDEFADGFKSLDMVQKCFFIAIKETKGVAVKKLSEILSYETMQSDLNLDLTKTYFAFLDPSSGINPGWSLRTFLAALLHHCPCLSGKNIQVIGIRCTPSGTIDKSNVFDIQIPEDVQRTESSGWVGWERNDKGNFGPKLANMSASMDPIKLAETSSDLNIKLMKWRLVPDINIDVMKTTKCLLLGAGTLGCHVARDLLAWGFRHITFMDNGKVSYSNPTRQVLYNFQDCLNGGKKKAEAAAENLKLILPTVQSKGQVVHIPMPGHPVGDSMRVETIGNINTITQAISDHDVIFLLLDTREARWLPTLIASYYGKIVINAALGFDSYLVMRHGVYSPTKDCDISLNKSTIDGDQLGCYFCNDVTAPGNSVKDRTLDQQCTVTRPGTAAIAGALAVEILVALLQHPLRVNAPAVYNLNDDFDQELPPGTKGILGPVPHSIRGFLHSYQTLIPTCAKFKNCIACSNIVINKYKEEGLDFLLNVFNSGSYLETITGLSELHLTAEMTDILTLSDDDDDEE